MRHARVGYAGVVVVLSALTSFAQRPASSGRAPAEFFVTEAGVDGPTPGARFLATLPSSALEPLRREGRAVLETKDNGMLRAVIRFERPVDEVFAVLAQPSAQQRYLPHVDLSKTVGLRTEEGEETDMAISFLFVKFNFRVQHWYYPEQHRTEWALDPSTRAQLSEQVGFFQLYALDEKTTIAEYGTRVVAKDGFVNFLRGLGERGGIAEALTAVRRHVHLTK